jgi:threonine/homoserine/homoserine lactone efflux protein
MGAMRLAKSLELRHVTGMSLDLFLALLTFAFVSSVTPGPNNTMVLASGLNFGVRRSIPHMLGIGVGFTLMVFLVGVGLGNVFKAYPALYSALKYAGAAYMLWLAWKIAMSGPMGEAKAGGTPITFLQAALFQWVNPKAWIMAVTANATYSILGYPVMSALIVAGCFALSSLPSNTIWVSFGAGLRQILSDPKTLRIFNIGMAVLLVASLAPLLYH